MGRNQLVGAASSYLRSAANQPVWWYAWGPEPFDAARAADRPVLLDIGAVWCHWCHVMDHESYENLALAELLNANFICVKVDRDERPDVDIRYQRAVQALTRQGGWPLTGFLTPDAELFFGGTYFPPQPAPGMPSFRQIIERVMGVWRSERAAVRKQAGVLGAALQDYLDESAPGQVDGGVIADAGHRILAAADPVHGGFGHRPKFPHPATTAFLLHRWCDDPEPTVRQVIERTLDGMANGGFRDLLGGGFHRYSVDERWIVPHFEKMASDNAELLSLFAAAGALFQRPDWLEAAADTVRWIDETLAQPGGGFGASQDADRGPSDDGSYFTWTAAEMADVLEPEEREVALARYGVGTHGRMPHDPERNVLFRGASAEALAGRFQLSLDDVTRILTAVDRKLRQARQRREPPFVDPARYAGWNAMLAGALLRAGPSLGSARAAELGLAALTRLRKEQPLPDVVAHVPGRPPGLLEDPVWAASAALDAWEMSVEPSWLAWAESLMDAVIGTHWDSERGGFLDRSPAASGEGLLRLPAKPIQDSPNASPNGIAGITLARLFEHTGAPRWRERHAALVAAFGGLGQHLGLFASAYLMAADWLAHPAIHLLITGPAEDPLARELHQQALGAFVPRRVVTRVAPGGDPDRLPPPLRPLAQGAQVVRGVACIGDHCLAPAGNVAEWRVRLRSLVPAVRQSG